MLIWGSDFGDHVHYQDSTHVFVWVNFCHLAIKEIQGDSRKGLFGQNFVTWWPNKFSATHLKDFIIEKVR
jgi:hypothetical protein